MPSACVLIKSPNPSTYAEVVKRVRAELPGIDQIEWVFFNATRDDSIWKNGGLSNRVTVTVRSVHDANDLIPILRRVDLCDVSGLPKEDLVHVLGLVLGRRKPKICTLTRDANDPYIDLMSQSTLKAFNRGYLVKMGFLSSIAILAGCSILALAVLKLTDLVPSSETWASWIGITLTALGIVLTYRSLRYG